MRYLQGLWCLPITENTCSGWNQVPRISLEAGRWYHLHCASWKRWEITTWQQLSQMNYLHQILSHFHILTSLYILDLARSTKGQVLVFKYSCMNYVPGSFSCTLTLVSDISLLVSQSKRSQEESNCTSSDTCIFSLMKPEVQQ